MIPSSAWRSGDGIVRWRSRPLQRSGEADSCDVSVAGVARLDLAVETDYSAYGRAVWVAPHLLVAMPGAPQVTADHPEPQLQVCARGNCLALWVAPYALIALTGVPQAMADHPEPHVSLCVCNLHR